MPLRRSHETLSPEPGSVLSLHPLVRSAQVLSVTHPFHQVACQGPSPDQPRGCLPLLVRCRSSSAFAARAESHAAPSLSKRLRWVHVPCCCSTFIEYPRLLLVVEDSALRQLALTTLASADGSTELAEVFSTLFPHRYRCASLARPDKCRDLPGQVLSPSLGPRRACLPSVPGGYWASPSIAGFPRCGGLLSGFCSSSPSHTLRFLQTPPHDGRPCFS